MRRNKIVFKELFGLLKVNWIKNMKRLLLVLLIPYQIFSQNIEKEFIKSSSQYYWGEAYAQNVDEAEHIAYDKLSKMISVTVSSSFEVNKFEDNQDVTESVEQVVKTYARATINNVEKMVTPFDEGFEVFLYIKRSDVQKIFDERKSLIRDLYDQGLAFESDANFAYALKSYYFCLILMNSVPESNIYYKDNINLTTEIPFRINTILQNVSFRLMKDEIVSDKEREIRLKVFVGDNEAKSLEFSFWDGVNQIHVTTLDGVAIVKLFGASVNFSKLNLSIKYQFYECRDEIKAVGELWNYVSKPSFKANKQLVLEMENTLEPKPEIEKIDQNLISSINKGSYNLQLVNNDSCNIESKIGEETLILLELIEARDIGRIKKYYINDPYISEKILSILKYNNIEILDNAIMANINKTFIGWEVRKIRVLNSYNTLRKQTPEYLIFDFDKNGRLYDINFGISESLYEKFVNQANYGNDWGNRQVIIKFMEKYRTTFLTRDINMLDSLFAEEALIIVGRVLKKNKNKDVSGLYNQLPNVEYLRYTKDEYIDRQRRIFRDRQDLFVGYSTFNISRKNKQPSVYGISMRQNYNSTGYSDEGYLFLLVDFENELPQIYVRSWQPQEWDENDLIKLSSFNINK